MIAELIEILSRHQTVTDVDLAAGTFQLGGDGRSVRGHIAPPLLEEYLDQLDDESLPGLSQAPPAEQDHLRLKHVSLLIEELFESDLDGSLLEVDLSRDAEGRVFVERRRGGPRRPVPQPGEGGFWSSES